MILATATMSHICITYGTMRVRSFASYIYTDIDIWNSEGQVQKLAFIIGQISIK